MATATIPMAVTSPKQIDDAKQRAVAATHAAYAPQPVLQPDGSTLNLCWMGRVARAYQLLQSAENKERLRRALTVLESRAKVAFNDAEKAASDYTALCAAAGVVSFSNVYPPVCECDGCRLGSERNTYYAALAELREAAWALLLPAHIDAPLPALVELVEATGERQEAGRKELWERLCRLALSQKNFGKAADALGERPDWQGALR